MDEQPFGASRFSANHLEEVAEKVGLQRKNFDSSLEGLKLQLYSVQQDCLGLGFLVGDPDCMNCDAYVQCVLSVAKINRWAIHYVTQKEPASADEKDTQEEKPTEEPELEVVTQEEEEKSVDIEPKAKETKSSDHEVKPFNVPEYLGKLFSDLETVLTKNRICVKRGKRNLLRVEPGKNTWSVWVPFEETRQEGFSQIGFHVVKGASKNPWFKKTAKSQEELRDMLSDVKERLV